jgi:hypothetical protein
MDIYVLKQTWCNDVMPAVYLSYANTFVISKASTLMYFIHYRIISERSTDFKNASKFSKNYVALCTLRKNNTRRSYMRKYGIWPLPENCLRAVPAMLE